METNRNKYLIADKGGNMSQKPDTPSRQVLRTRSWILEALMLLMEKGPYGKITVSDIISKAGIARQTFYRSYTDKDEVLMDYLRSSLRTDVLKIESGRKNGEAATIVLAFYYDYIIANHENLKKILSIPDIASRIIREIQQFPLVLIEEYKNKLSPEDYLICRYKITFQIIGSLTLFFDWFVNDMPMDIEKFIGMLNAMNTPKVVQYRHIPCIEMRIIKNEAKETPA